MSDNEIKTQKDPASAPLAKKKGFKFPQVDRTLARLFFITIGIFVVLSLILPTKFPTAASFDAMSVQFPEIGLLAIAIMITMLTGGIDLSVTNIALLSGILAATTMTKIIQPNTLVPDAQAYPVILLAIAVSVVVGLLCGLLNGILVAVVNITPILATLGTGTLFSGFSIVITGGTAVFGFPQQFLFLGEGNIFNIPMPLILFAGVVIAFWLILNNTSFGIKLYMMGSNPKAARFSGVDNKWMLIRTYVLSGLLGALAGLLIIARTNSAKEDYGSSYVLLAILIAILGGVNPSGGFGRIAGLVLAVLSLQFLSTGLSMLLIGISGSNFFKEFAWGAVLVIVMAIDYFSIQQRLRSGQVNKIVKQVE